MTTPGSPVCAPEWLALREDADAAARAEDLIAFLPPSESVLDLGCGSGSMSRWLAPRLPGPSHWILADRDPDLLARALADLPAGTTGEARRLDVATLTAADLAGVDLVTASALLDLLTADEVDRLAAACVEAGVPALLALTVVGEARLDPAEPCDAVLAAAFDAHQRREVDGRRLLGPDAGATAVTAFRRRGARVQTRPSPWHLDTADPAHAALAAEWLDGWVGAALLQEPRRASQDYLARRRDQVAAGTLRVSVGHVDVLAVP